MEYNVFFQNYCDFLGFCFGFIAVPALYLFFTLFVIFGVLRVVRNIYWVIRAFFTKIPFNDLVELDP